MTYTSEPAVQIAGSPSRHLVRVGPREGLPPVTVVSGGRHGIAVFAPEDSDRVYAVDNRCPHMGFPLHKGSVCNGILTCHWHNARFDLESGGTLDPFADDVHTYDVVIEDGIVYVDPERHGVDRIAHARARLRDGLRQSIRLVLAKNTLALLEAGVPSRDILEIGGTFGAEYRASGWRSGLTILTAMGNIADRLDPGDRMLALYHGLVNVARDCVGQPPRHALSPLPTTSIPANRLESWFRQCIEVRDTDGAERALLTAIASDLPEATLAHLLASAATDHAFIDGGHTLDFVNKATELLDLIGWDHAHTILPSLTPVLAQSTRSEERSAWRHPIDLIALIAPPLERIDTIYASSGAAARAAAGSNPAWTADDAMIDVLLGDDPAAIVTSLTGALEAGAPVTAISQALSYAAALRIARFHTSNEFGDWITVLHTFTYANAVHQLMKRAPSPELLRGVYHGAMQVYLDRFLNMPAARLPEDRSRALDALPADAATILNGLRDALDREQQVELAGQLTWRYLDLGHDPGPLIAALGGLLLREDGEFHSYQMLEAGIALSTELAPTQPDRANRVLVAIARYLAAHAPTSRSMLQTAGIARRLARGDDVYVDTDPE
jgi:nitrite reductase/ring-hydroxylating ferredoxin subunit